MKNLVLIIIIASFVLTSCSKEEHIEPIHTGNLEWQPLIESQADQVFYVLERTEETLHCVKKTFDNSRHLEDTSFNGYSFTEGLYQTALQEVTHITWTGFTDETGTYGTAEIQIETSSLSLHFTVQADCVTVMDGKAVFGGGISEVFEQTTRGPQIGIDWGFYFQATESETGFDTLSNTMILTPPNTASLCALYPPNHPIWSSEGHTNVYAPGYVAANNHPE